MKNLLLFLVVTLSVTNSYSDVVLLDKGQVAPYTGVLFTPEQARDLKNTVIERDYLKDINASQLRMVDLYKQNEVYYKEEKTLLLEQNDKLAKSLHAERQLGTWEKIGYFGLGVVATSAAVYVAAKLIKVEFR